MRQARILQGDCRAVLRSLPAGSVDAVVTDPPYGERAASWDGPRSSAWHVEWIGECHRVLRPGGPLVSFASRRYLDFLMGALRSVRGDTPECPLQTGAWVHRQGHPVGDGLLRPEHEPFVASGKLRVEADDVRGLRSYHTPHNVNRKPTHRRANARGFATFTYTPHEVGPMAGTVLEAARNKPAEALGHPTQKPEEVMRYLVALAAAPGEVVLDPFSGSGTTGVVALRLGRQYIGIELSPEYVEMSRRRLEGDAPLVNAVEVEEAPEAEQLDLEAPSSATTYRRGYDHQAGGWTLEVHPEGEPAAAEGEP